MRWHRALNAEGAANRIDRAGKLYQDAIAGSLHKATAMFGDLRLQEGLAQRFERAEGTFLVATHQPAVANDVSCEYCCQPPFGMHLGHNSP